MSGGGEALATEPPRWAGGWGLRSAPQWATLPAGAGPSADAAGPAPAAGGGPIGARGTVHCTTGGDELGAMRVSARGCRRRIVGIARVGGDDADVPVAVARKLADVAVVTPPVVRTATVDTHTGVAEHVESDGP